MTTTYQSHYQDFLISTDPSLLNLEVIHEFLTRSYWAQGIAVEIVKQSLENSLCFGVYHHQRQVGFARVITDYATFAYLADVFILEECRGQGLSKWLMATLVAHPDLQGLRRWLLATRDAHELYRQYGFADLASPERWMERYFPDIYSTQ
ncbi:MAG: GNAT family N-acetyltransferase [Acidobacteria bacterium]|nr:GNAT family N-acetyltransferase [Acidobacteriota bacterium]